MSASAARPATRPTAVINPDVSQAAAFIVGLIEDFPIQTRPALIAEVERLISESASTGGRAA